MQAGPTNQSLNILVGLKKKGLDVTLLTFDPEVEGDSWLNKFTEAGINIHQLNLKTKNPFTAAKYLRKYVRENRVDIIHGCGTRVDIIAFLANVQAKKVVTHRSYPNMIAEEAPLLIRKLVVPLYMHILKKMDSVVACSKSMQKAFLQECNMSMECVQNAVNTEFFRPISTEEKAELRKKMGIDNIPTYLVLGVLLPRKNNEVIIQAINSIPDFVGQVLFVGGGSEETKLRQLASDNQRIKFCGSTLTPINYLQVSDYFISASISEGLPNSVLEAISCGLVPILSNIEPHKEIVENSSVDFRFAPSDSAELVRCLKTISKIDQNTLSISARKLSIEKFGVDAMAAKYIDIYKTTLLLKDEM